MAKSIKQRRKPDQTWVKSSNQPPEDDCCPICCDSFKSPCQTSCGHWFCGSCFVSYWRHSEGMKLCNCPICGRLVNNLTPYSSQWFRPQILVSAYNHQYVFGWFAKARKLVISLVRWSPHDDNENTLLAFCCRKFQCIYLCVALAFNMSLFGLISHKLAEMIRGTPWGLLYVICSWLMIVIECDKRLFRPRRRRARRLAEAQEGLFSNDEDLFSDYENLFSGDDQQLLN